MRKYRVVGAVAGSKYLGVFEANSPEEAVEKALEAEGHVSLCHQCCSECEDAEIDGGFAEEVADGGEPQPEGDR